jgi:hypothetical protein
VKENGNEDEDEKKKTLKGRQAKRTRSGWLGFHLNDPTNPYLPRKTEKWNG